MKNLESQRHAKRVMSSKQKLRQQRCNYLNNIKTNQATKYKERKDV